jgi:hypothetical protein
MRIVGPYDPPDTGFDYDALGVTARPVSAFDPRAGAERK